MQEEAHRANINDNGGWVGESFNFIESCLVDVLKSKLGSLKSWNSFLESNSGFSLFFCNDDRLFIELFFLLSSFFLLDGCNFGFLSDVNDKFSDNHRFLCNLSILDLNFKLLCQPPDNSQYLMVS